MKNSEIRALTVQELTERIAAEKENLQRLSFAHEISPIENPMKIRHARKLIARLMTELKAKSLA